MPMKTEPENDSAAAATPDLAPDLTLPDSPRVAEALVRAAALMARLRTAPGGCPWDLEQTFKTIAPYTIEEAYEVADAIARNDLGQLKDELGDLLFQVLFHARMAQELSAFDLADVADGLVSKMVRRHPHVFGAPDDRSAQDQVVAWEEIKAAERKRKSSTTQPSLLDDVPLALPALLRAEKLTKRAARIGFDWPNADQVIEKLHEELGELQDAAAQKDQAAIKEEMGDLLFVAANLARKLGVDAEDALRDANAKFERRFRHVEQRAAAMHTDAGDLETLEGFWNEAKAAEKAAKP